MDFFTSSFLGGLFFEGVMIGSKAYYEKLELYLKDKMLSDVETQILMTVLKNATEEDLKDEESIKNYLELKLDLKKFAPKIKIRLNKPTSCIGREKDLKKLKESLAINSKAVLMNGLGGVGKTTLAKEFYCENLGEYENCIWLDYQETLVETISTFPSLEGFLEEKIEDPQTAFHKFIQNLGDLQGKNLLVIDNANNIEDIRGYNNTFPKNWTVLITSRGDIEGFEKLNLDVLEIEDARELFFTYYKEKGDDKKVDKILETIHRHTLLIELLAKTAEKGRVPLGKLLEKAQEYGHKISEEIKVKVSSTHSENKKDFVHAYIDKIFDVSDLKKREKNLLKNFTLLPSIPINLDFFIDLYKKDRYKTIETLESLGEKGWIQKIDKESFFLHQTLQEVLKEKLQPTTKSCKDLIEGIIQLTNYDEYENNLEKGKYLPYCYSLEKNILNKNNKEMFQVLENIASINRDIGDLQKALFYQKRVLNLGLEIFDNISEEIATVYHNLATIYQQNGDLEATLEYQLKSIKIYKKIYDTENHPNLATAYGNLANIYRAKGDLEKALEYQKKNIEICKEIYDTENHPNLATAYGNLAGIYQDKGDLDLALEYQLKDIEIEKKIYDTENHPNLLIAYWNLAMMYYQLEDNKQFLHYLQKAYAIYTFNFPDGHSIYKAVEETYKQVFKES